MTKQEFIVLYQEKMNLSSKRESEKLINGLFSALEEVLLKGESITIIGFGKFEIATQSPRTYRNPRTAELVHTPEKKVIKFRVGKSFAKKILE